MDLFYVYMIENMFFFFYLYIFVLKYIRNVSNKFDDINDNDNGNDNDNDVHNICMLYSFI